MTASKILLLCLLTFPIQMFGQSKIFGKITDKETKQAVDFASIYINGSTNGTISDSLGNFMLRTVKFPCTVVISHLAYHLKSYNLKDSVDSPLSLTVNPRKITIDEVNVSDKNMREANLSIFRNQFLGTDVWGRYANIENEDAIQFKKEYKTEQSVIYNKILPNFIQYNAKDLEWSEDSTLITYKTGQVLYATSSQPLKINLPLLGYTLFFDLLEFSFQYQSDLKSELITTLGYFYFRQQIQDSKRDSIRVQKNRSKDYYNSAQHFCRSLYEKKLAQNGYLIYGSFKDEKTGNIRFKEVDLESCVEVHENYAEIIGLENRKLIILYFNNLKRMPKDPDKKLPVNGIQSEVLFLKDTCIIRNTGIIPNNSIVFGSAIGEKKIGSVLPDEYVPTEQ